MTAVDIPEQEFHYTGPPCRLDHFLSRHLNDISRSRLQDLVRKGAVLVNDGEVKTSYRLKEGDLVRVTIPAPEPLDLPAQDLPLEVVYEDSHLIVVDKEAGMVVHPAAGHYDGTLVNALLFHCGDLAGIGGVQRPGIVHRLDQDTSGLLVVAKDDFTHQGLAAQFKEHSITRQYTALAYGRLLPVSGSFVSEIGRHPRQRKKMASVPSGGKPARTNYRVLRYFPRAACSLVSLELETGRTHQIRVHLSEAGYPLVGDRTYGRKGARRRSEQTPALKLLSDFPRQALHAGRLGFIHPVKGEYLEFDSPLPDDFRNLLERLDELAEGA
ncbi:MAG: RluA family pseudouridine synthase [Deltaproteobacteria bacterium]|nr:RluA family pseudouridine synthase [Deltaproteobacteria bacterium]